jgi:nucleoside-diphosphate-sugar epimerase
MILVTGADGCVGRQVVRYLSGQGYHLRLVRLLGSPSSAPSVQEAETVNIPDLFSAPPDWWR